MQGKPPPHPLMTLLSSLPQRSFLSAYHFNRLISTREANFLNPTFHTLQDLADYSAGTQASLLYLLLQATAASSSSSGAAAIGGGAGLRHSTPFQHQGGEHEGAVDGVTTNGGGGGTAALREADDLTLDHAASHLAVAVTIATLLRSIPHHAGRRTSVIPLDIGAPSPPSASFRTRQKPKQLIDCNLCYSLEAPTAGGSALPERTRRRRFARCRCPARRNRAGRAPDGAGMF